MDDQLISISDVFTAMCGKRWHGLISRSKIAEVPDDGKGTTFNPNMLKIL
jgi:hypothetical protein